MIDKIADNRTAPIEVNGEVFLADPSGALYWPSQKTLLVADLHFEKGTSYSQHGLVLPPYDTRKTLKNLKSVCSQWKPNRVIALGDSFHDTAGPERLAEEDRNILHELVGTHDWVWVTGNHDAELPPWLGGQIVAELSIAGISFRHEPSQQSQTSEIVGHFHPCAKVRLKGRQLRRRCFLSDGFHLVLPAFGAYTGGLNVCDPAFLPFIQTPWLVWMLGRSNVYRFPQNRLLADQSL